MSDATTGRQSRPFEATVGPAPMGMMDRMTMIHVLRNPWGWHEDAVRGVRNMAATELERLWKIEHAADNARELLALHLDRPNAQVHRKTGQHGAENE